MLILLWRSGWILHWIHLALGFFWSGDLIPASISPGIIGLHTRVTTAECEQTSCPQQSCFVCLFLNLCILCFGYLSACTFKHHKMASDSCELLCGCWEWTSGLLEVQWVPLTTAPSLSRSWIHFLFKDVFLILCVFCLNVHKCCMCAGARG